MVTTKIEIDSLAAQRVARITERLRLIAVVFRALDPTNTKDRVCIESFQKEVTALNEELQTLALRGMSNKPKLQVVR